MEKMIHLLSIVARAIAVNAAVYRVKCDVRNGALGILGTNKILGST